MTSVVAPSPKMTVLEHGTENGIDWVTCRAPMYGAVNGYVRIPESHPWRDLIYDDEAVDVTVNGGLTYSNDEWFGFDTMHAGDLWPDMPHSCRRGECDCTHWTPEMVAAETRSLARQVAAVGVSTKIVYNGCHGGFGLSDDAICEYLRRTGREWVEEPTGFSIVPIRFKVVDDDAWNVRDIPRTDPVLVAIVEEWGERANGPHADLQIRELPKGTLYRIDEYDGWERVETRDDIDWSIA